MNHQRNWIGLSLAIGLAFAAEHGHASSSNDLYDLSLEELLSVPVTSVSRRDQTLAQTAAAVYVITADEIMRSQASSVPELLRNVPGMHVASIDSNKWAISARGLNGRYATKLLVLQDGRSLYSPFFSGVYWDTVDLLLEDIERIEVIRGPGASLWGANAVNGVINIITKDARDTQDGVAKAQSGTHHSQVSLRQGWTVGENGAMRAYAQISDYNDSQRVTGDTANDAWLSARAGLRLDWIIDVDSDITITTDIFSNNADETTNLSLLQAPYSIQTVGTNETDSGNILARYRRAVSPRSEISISSYVDYYDRKSQLYEEHRSIFDIDYQQSLDDVASVDWLWGLNFRRTEDQLGLDLVTTGIGTDVPSREDNLFGGFVQGNFDLGTENWEFTLGSKFEENDYTGFEIQPNVRAIWSAEPSLSVWASIARAVRTPTRAESDSIALLANSVLPPLTGFNQLPVPLAFGVIGNTELEAEDLTAYEIGVRKRFDQGLVADLAFFYNDYENLRGIEQIPPTCQPTGESLFVNPTCFIGADYVLGGGMIANTSVGDFHGVELALDWQVGSTRLQGSYSYLDGEVASTVIFGASAEDGDQSSPKHLLSLRSSTSIGQDHSLDLAVRYADKISLPTSTLAGFVNQQLDDYVSVDAQWRWQVMPALELSLRATNLFDDRRIEYVSEAGEIDSGLVEREVSARIRYVF